MCFDQRSFLGLSVSLLALVGVGAEKPLSTAVGAAFPSPVDTTGVATDPEDPTAILVPISAEGPAGFFKLYADE